jgi:hypothetical protein
MDGKGAIADAQWLFLSTWHAIKCLHPHTRFPVIRSPSPYFGTANISHIPVLMAHSDPAGAG